MYEGDWKSPLKISAEQIQDTVGEALSTKSSGILLCLRVGFDIRDPK